MPGPTIPGQIAPVLPVLQLEDGSFAGTAYTGTSPRTTHMVVFSAGGNVLWSVPSEEPVVALKDGGVLAKSGVVYRPNGSATGQVSSMPILSWTGNAYRNGSVQQVAAKALDVAVSFWPFQSGETPAEVAIIPFADIPLRRRRRVLKDSVRAGVLRSLGLSRLRHA